MVYVWKKANGRIVSFGELSFVVEGDDYIEEFQGSMEDYAGRFKLSADKLQIIADGQDEAIVTVSSNSGQATISVNVNGVVVDVEMVGGQGQLPPITAETTGGILIKPADETVFCSAGEGLLGIFAQEV